ncbi:MAG TPA: hypothetical protein VI306_02470 [Pyrinomonadaceae bacterium]
MDIDKKGIRTQEDLGEEAPIDQIEDRVEAKMKKIEGNAKQSVAEGLDDDELAREGDKLQKEGETELKKAKQKAS